MAYDLSALSNQVVMRPPRIVVLGEEKIGKSTFVSQAPGASIIPVVREEGIDELPVFKFPTIKKYVDLLGWLESLCNQEHNFQSVAIDSASALEPLVWSAVCDRCKANSIETIGGGYGKGYIEALSEWDHILGRLDYLRNNRNMITIIVGHVHVRRFDDPKGPSYDQYQWDINHKAASRIYRWADSILFCGRKVAVQVTNAGFGKEKGKALDIGQGQPFLYTKKRPSHPGGGRGVYGRLPYELPLSWAAYQDAITQAVSQPLPY